MTAKKAEPKTKKQHDKDRAPRKDAFYVNVKSMDIIEGLNLRTDYGDLNDLAGIIARTPDKIPPLRGFKTGDRYAIVQGHRRRLSGLLAAEALEKGQTSVLEKLLGNLMKDYKTVEDFIQAITEGSPEGDLLSKKKLAQIYDDYQQLDEKTRKATNWADWILTYELAEVILLVLPEAKGTTDEERTIDMFLTNEGKKLTLLEQAEGVRRLQDNFNMHEKFIAARIYKSVTYVRNCIKLLKAPADIQKLMHDGIIKPTLVIQLLKEMPLERAAEVLRETIDNMQTAPATNQISLELGETPKTGGEDADNIVSQDNEEKTGAAGTGRINPTATDFVVKPFEDREPPQVMKGKVTRSDVDKVLHKVNSVSIFRKILNHSPSELVLEDRAEEFVFIQRMIEGLIGEEEICQRFFGKKSVALDGELDF